MERGWCLPSVPLPRSGKRLRRKRIDGDRSEHRQSPSKDSERKAGNAPLRSLKTELNKNRWLLCAKNKKQTVSGWITLSCLRLSAFSTLRGCHIFSNATAPIFLGFKPVQSYLLAASICAATSAAKSSSFFSMPSPTSNLITLTSERSLSTDFRYSATVCLPSSALT